MLQVMLGEYLDDSLRWLPLAKNLGVRVFAHAHGYDVPRFLCEARWRLEYGKYEQADGIVTMSRTSKARLVELGLNRVKIHVIPYDVDVPGAPARRQDRGVVRCVAVGRMVAKKGPILTLDALRRAAQVLPELRMDYIGGGDLLPAARQFVRALDLDARVTLHDSQPRAVVDQLMSEADIFVQHSLTDPDTGDQEGLPVAILEAMASGLPVLSTRHAGIPEAVVDGVTGYLVEEGDCAGMVDKLVALAREVQLRRRLGEAGWRRAKATFSWERERAALLTLLGLAEWSPGTE